jgi:hypothetical protein
MSSVDDDLEKRIYALEIGTQGGTQKLQQITTLLKFAVLIPLTIVVGNHLGSFLPLPVVCKEFSFGGVTSRLMSHVLLLFLIGFSISGNIDYSIFGWSGDSLGLDFAFTILSWLFLLMLLRLRHSWMYVIVGVSILIAYVFFIKFKNAYDARVEKLKAGETVSSEQEKKDYQAAFYTLVTMFLLVVIFYLISAYEYVKTLPNYYSTYTKPIKLENGDKYFVQQQKLQNVEKVWKGLTHMFNPEIPSDTLCAEIRSKDYVLPESINVRKIINNITKPKLKSNFGDTATKSKSIDIDDLKNEIDSYSRNIFKYSPSFKREIYEQKSFLDNIPTLIINPLTYISKAKIVEKKSFADLWQPSSNTVSPSQVGLVF